MSNKAILCVDDEFIILETLVEQLEKKLGNKYIYETAETAEEGLEVLEELINDNVDILIIVSDWLMPGMKGDEFLTKVYQQFPDIVTVMLTGQADEESIVHAKNSANLHACLFKPWSEEELIRTIKSGLEKL
ncbi:response regulator [Candidatus Parabeggiatoa sp. HSG14]|uniref:response regulator n=1 Tax=Candidatus Parabeggiatoa sp. HSG14 TaxID=3055593 RepID=UPI0025A91B54|nr:response regulator [Thiotrichales bacterium HSG14]